MMEPFKDISKGNVGDTSNQDESLNWKESSLNNFSEMEKRYFGLLQNLDAGIVIHDADSTIKENNPKASDLLGLSDDQLKGKLAIDPAWNFVNEKGEPISYSQYPVNLLGNENQNIKKLVFGVIRPKTNDLVWLEVGGFVIRNSNNEVHEIVVYFIDITEKRNAEIAYRMSEEKFSTAFHTSPFTITISELNTGKFIDTNEAFTKVLGYSKELAQGKTSTDLGLWLNPEERNEALLLLRNEQPILGKEYLFKKKNGEQIIGSYTANVFRVEGQSYVLSIMDDISEEKQAKEEIKNKNEELVRINEAKDKFFSIVSHDLRGPINGFLSLTQLLLEDINSLNSEEIQSIILSMKNSAKNLFNLMENMLQWSRIQNGTFPFVPERLLLDKLIEECIVSINDQAKIKSIQIQSHVLRDIEIEGDRNMLQTVFRNLIGNAIKFSNPGGVISLIAKPTHDGFVEVVIEDSGIGMDEKTKLNLFSFHSQKCRKGTNGEPSSGLGLVLCKEFIEKHNGRIWVKSEVNKGSHFFVMLPMKNK